MIERTPLKVNLTEHDIRGALGIVHDKSVVVGSLARNAFLGIDPFTYGRYRPDGTLRDIDVVARDGSTALDWMPESPIRIDASMTKFVLPRDDGSIELRIPGESDPRHMIDSKYSELEQISIAGTAIETFSPAIHNELMTLTGPYVKNSEHAYRFAAYAADKIVLPLEVQKAFAVHRCDIAEYKLELNRVRDAAKKESDSQHPIPERLYRKIRRIALRRLPPVVTETLRPAVRKVRDTKA